MKQDIGIGLAGFVTLAAFIFLIVSILQDLSSITEPNPPTEPIHVFPHDILLRLEAFLGEYVQSFDVGSAVS